MPISVTADSDGRFQAERQLDPLVIFAATPDRKLGAMVTLGAENTEVVIPVAPMATATGILIDEKKRPVANTPLEWGRRVYLDEEQKLNDDMFWIQGRYRLGRSIHAAGTRRRSGV